MINWFIDNCNDIIFSPKSFPKRKVSVNHVVFLGKEMLNRKVNSDVRNKQRPKQCHPSNQDKGISRVFKDDPKKSI